MNWDAIGAVGEIVGALAVVVSLLYLATQIRTSNRAVKQAANREMMDEMSHWYAQISRDIESAELWLRGCAEDETLTRPQLFQFGILLQQALIVWERLNHLEQSNEIEDWFLHHVKHARLVIAGTPGFRSWFDRGNTQISESLRRVLQEEIETSLSRSQKRKDSEASSSVELNQE